MKRTLAWLLALLLILPLFAACGKKGPETDETDTKQTEETRDSAQKETEDPFREKLSREALDDFPLAPGSEMSVERMRALCVDFFRFSKRALWSPDADVSYIRSSSGARDEMEQGAFYGGLPTIALGSGNIYRLMDWYDEDSGLVNMEEAMKNPRLFGTNSASAAFWSWSRVIHSAAFLSPETMTSSAGFLPVGPYTYDGAIQDFSAGTSTVQICQDNGREVLYESYAAMQLADGLVSYTTTGRVAMCSGEPVVVRTDEKIDPEASYLLITEQGQNWQDGTMPDGTRFQMKTGIDVKISFRELFDASLIPFTFGEFLGTQPCEETLCVFDYAGGDYIDIEELRQGVITSNYPISDLYVTLSDKEGNVVESRVKRAENAGMRTVALDSVIFTGTWEEYYNKDYTVSLSCQLGTGERIQLYRGRLSA